MTDYDEHTQKGIDFLTQFKTAGITHDAKRREFQQTLDFQDFIGHMTTDQLFDFYEQLDQDFKGIFIWSCLNTQHFDTCVDIIKSTTIRSQRRKLYDDFDQYACKKELELAKREDTFEACKKPIHKKIRYLNSEIETLRNRLAWNEETKKTLQESNRQLHRRNAELENKACDFDNLKAAFQLVLS